MATTGVLDIKTNTKGIRTITMNRPEVHNAFDDNQVQRLIQAFENAATDNNVRVVVLAGAGKSFSAGGDIDYMRRMGENSYEQNLADGGQLAQLMKSLNNLPKPTIARVQGATMGGGVGLVCCCDYAIGSPRARFATSEVKLGVLPATIAPYVVATIGEKAARRMFMSGQPVSDEQAVALGILSDVVPEEKLDSAVEALADTLVKNGPDAVRLAKQLTFDVSHRPVSEELIAATVRLIADARDSDEGREGLNAFLQKRPPNWTAE